MTKRITISLSDWVFNSYLKEITQNRSKHIEEMIVKGTEDTLGETETRKSQVLTLIKENKELYEQLKLLNIKLSRYKQNHNRHGLTEEEYEAEKIADGIRASGVLLNDDD